MRDKAGVFVAKGQGRRSEVELPAPQNLTATEWWEEKDGTAAIRASVSLKLSQTRSLWPPSLRESAPATGSQVTSSHTERTSHSFDKSAIQSHDCDQNNQKLQTLELASRPLFITTACRRERSLTLEIIDYCMSHLILDCNATTLHDVAFRRGTDLLLSRGLRQHYAF